MTELQKSPWPDWEMVRLIGRGSFGAVYEIQRKLVDEDTETAALKVISIPQNPGDVEEMYSEGYDDESITATFNSHLKSIVAEYSLMRKMDGSANIVNCKDIRYIQHDDGIGWDIFIRMELLTPLMKALPVNVSEDAVIKVAKDICAALVLCKKYEIVHRDIKPQNIFVSANGDYKLGDFGIAKTVEKTMGGTKIGTYKYMAPEVYNNQPYGSGADIYSLGLVLYWLLNERRMPFMPPPPAKLKAGQDEEARHRRLSGEKLPEPAHGSDELKRIVLKACAYDQKDRYASAVAMLDDLNRLAGGTINPDTIADSNNIATQEDDFTTGLVFGDTQKQTTASEYPEFDATVGPVFEKKAVSAKEHTAKVSASNTAAKFDKTEAAKKKKISKLIILGLIALGIVAVIIISLLLRSCTGNNDAQLTEAGETTRPTTTQTEESSPVQAEWSAWADELPDYVNTEDYKIEEQILYRSRSLETTSSTTQDTMDGWELYETVSGNGEFGPWSDWSNTAITASESREVEQQTRYRYRDKETTTESSSTMSGWELYDTTYTWGDYGSWSDWSTSAVSNSDSRKVETKTQYRYRNISYTTEYTDWGGWSDWSTDRQSTSDLKKEESRTVWAYCYFLCPYCGAHMHGWGQCWTWAGGCGRATTDAYWHEVWSTTSWDQAGLKDWYGTGKYYTYIDEELVFKWSEGGSRTQYRYATRSTQQVANYGNWSSWGDTAYSNSSTREVQTRTVYRYCDRSQVATYHFYRWSDWTNWSTNAVSANSNREVETATYYRYREKATEPMYYFRRWTDWSDYTREPVAESSELEVQTKNQYRFRSKTEDELRNPFTDVDAEAFYFDAVMWASENGIINGTSATTFEPNGTVTRGQVITMLWRVAGKPAPSASDSPFKDVESDSPYHDAVLWATEEGIAGGETADTFGVESPCTRAQFITFLYRTVGEPEARLSQEPFSDVEPGSYFFDAVLWAYENGISSGVSATVFGVNEKCMRMQIAVMLYRAFSDV